MIQATGLFPDVVYTVILNINAFKTIVDTSKALLFILIFWNLDLSGFSSIF